MDWCGMKRGVQAGVICVLEELHDENAITQYIAWPWHLNETG